MHDSALGCVDNANKMTVPILIFLCMFIEVGLTLHGSASVTAGTFTCVCVMLLQMCCVDR